ncbi:MULTISPECIES: TetR/AcrR family transcriptional regulator [unclassified Streptomyces]|uniref:TetR/AcrR family transcriptional regulator n=1 Tax=unclassified Streptomyces TaxID=2593676 RepID=UPI002DD7EC26|nr:MULTISPECIES: TetR/AcrR family transcriptional regulator [unclassified Streptomyces]WSC34198.1 TetR/AcrR family transcriptional regulator [Streptomyces sp. NBC_01763]WSC41860.1 TetR/AcrR family transcriptional regulator [Streptomyces sp. NBC_01763]WSC42624.1 TetR/AcrR family transcriptional regulator [Streptomyces sp. NBC_01762]WSC50229.1 TetR/AcrR family transcriptional regulator [Streptomyces sp. NBC_01762]
MSHHHAPSVSESPAKPLRRDAQRNRDAIVAAARTAFSEQGLGASLEGVAREAGVAIGTLYRHFPTRLALVETLFNVKYTELLVAAEEAAAMDDAWEGFCRYMEKLCQLQACDRAFNDLVSARLPLHAAGREMHERAKEICTQIMHNAQEQGGLRGDVTAQDIAFVIWSQAGIIQATRTIAPQAWRRHLHLMLDAFRTQGAHELPEPPLTSEQADQTLTTLECNEEDCREQRP